jgi:hypothetical protein
MIIKFVCLYLLIYSRAPAQQACRILFRAEFKKLKLYSKGGRSHLFCFVSIKLKATRASHGSLE